MQSILLISQNLVPNPSFEEYYNCPTGLNQLHEVKDWTNPVAFPSSPDYFNRCNIGGHSGVPVNYFDTLEANNGNAYAGIGLYVISPSNGREYIQTPLSSPLEISKSYFVSFYISLAKTSQKAVSNFGCHFSDTEIVNHPAYLLPYTPQLETDTSIPLTSTSWKHIWWQYTAVGNEKFMTIGNFRNDQKSFLTNMNFGQYDIAYYYIDDVCVSLNPTDCGIDTTTTNITNVTKPHFEFKVFPNPARDFITLTYSNNTNLAYEIINPLGQSITGIQQLNNSATEQINTAAFSEGVYLLKVYGQNGLVRTERVIIQK